MIVTRLPDVEPRPRRVAVGTFDGVHLGHRAVIAGSDTVLTFDPHPLAVIAPDRRPPLLTTLERKVELIGELGVREVVVVPFDEGWARHSAQAFIDEVLAGALRATHVSVGENFRFGHRASGDPALLAADGRFEVRVAPMLEVHGEIVSSSLIRSLVLAGDVEAAGRLLGAPFRYAGIVEHGEKRGRELGFPTANLSPRPGYAVPAHGVYAAVAHLDDGTSAPAAVSIGVRPTFATELGVLVEVYLIDWTGDLYGRELRVDFLKRLRGELRFDSVEALVEQMHLDVDAALATVSGRT
ncbi:MAG: bifunctional riboflavin kinase/FAD synthetase [Solirubrobacteraceae bacterium]|nr:bifunctional riboflavin kinase/FAD synthetase [Solirubrobacteraceae bacterium]